MENLISLIDLISRQKLAQINIIDENLPTNLGRLYRGIMEGKISNQDDVLNQIYDGDMHKYKSASKLKNDLYNRLINSLFFIDINNYSKSKYEIALHKVQKNSVAITILLDRLKRKTAIDLAEKTIKTALRYDFVENVVQLAQKVAKHYTVYEYNNIKSTYYYKLTEEYLEYYNQEILADKIFAKLGKSVFGKKDKDFNKHYGDLVYLASCQDKNKNYYFNFKVFSSFYYYYLFSKDWNALLKTATKAIAFFERKEGFTPIALFTFNLQKAFSLFVLKQYRESIVFYKKAKDLGPTTGGVSWYNVNSYMFSNQLFLENYEACYTLVLESTAHKNFSTLLDQYKQSWLIKEAYFNLLIRLDKINIENSKLRKFRLNRFLNEVPHYSKDKRGLNISILIVQMLFYLLDKKYNDFIDRMDALKQYSYRYLRNDENLRSNCFIKMILKIPDAHYQPIAVKRHTKTLYEKMVNTPPEIADQTTNAEIIPYEKLWDMVLEILDKNKD